MDELFPELEDGAPRLLTGDEVMTEGTARSWATFSVDRRYRYLLGRQWNPDAPWLVCGMLNPSTAGGFDDDPTIRRLLGFARRDRYGGLLVWNAAALIATDPRELTQDPDPVGPRNREAILAAIRSPTLAHIVVAWGRPRNRAIEKLVARAFMEATCARPLWRFGDLTKGGWPRHPRYLRADIPIIHNT